MIEDQGDHWDHKDHGEMAMGQATCDCSISFHIDDISVNINSLSLVFTQGELTPLHDLDPHSEVIKRQTGPSSGVWMFGLMGLSKWVL